MAVKPAASLEHALLTALRTGPAAAAPGANRHQRRSARHAGRLAARLAAAAASPRLAPPRAAAAPRPHPTARSGLPQPAFAAIAATTQFGPPTDIAMGWDGTLWAIDSYGAPHLYDPLQDAWQAYGDGVDAAAFAGGQWHLFRGGEVLTIAPDATPQPIATAYPSLPDSFKLGVSAALGGPDAQLYLIKGGFWLSADGSRPAARLTALRDWPAAWPDGLVDGVLYVDEHCAHFVRGGEYVDVDMSQSAVLTAPQPLVTGSQWPSLPSGWQAGDLDAAVAQPGGSGLQWTVFKGPAVVGAAAAPVPLTAHFSGWPATWNPILAHAPTGRMGALWGVAKASVDVAGGYVAHHDGDRWGVMTDTWANSACATPDGTVFSVNPASQDVFWWRAASGWATFMPAPANLMRVSAGDATRVWAQGQDGTVYQADVSSQSFNPSAGVGATSGMTANPDGTVWHCRANDPQAYCFISEAAAAPSAAHSVGSAVARVTAVASSGYGSAYVLAQHQDASTGVYRYDTPYLFKTSQSYPVGAGGLVLGGGRLYCVGTYNAMPTDANTSITALDPHTGAELASYDPGGVGPEYSGVVFDALNNLVYLGVSSTGSGAGGAVVALDALTLTPRWTYTAPELAGVGQPVLAGAFLCFGDDNGTLRMINTGKAATSGQPSVAWTWQPIAPSGSIQAVPPPIIVGGVLYATIWVIDQSGGVDATCTISLASCNAADGMGQRVTSALHQVSVQSGFLDMAEYYPPVPGRMRASDGTEIPALFLNGYDSVLGHSLDPSRTPINAKFTLPAGMVYTGLTYDDGTRLGSGLSAAGPALSQSRIWFGDDQGNLWGLGDWLHPVPNIPFLVAKGCAISAAPLLYKDTQGGVTVLLGSSGDQNLLAFDPVNGNLSSLATGVTEPSVIIPGATPGLIYLGGSNAQNQATTALQTFGIRIDGLPQVLRDFVVDAQMLQDPDPGAPGPMPAPGDSDPVPPSRARYQVHLSVVDDRHNPIPHEPLKVWADGAMDILVDGKSYVIGSGDSDFAMLATGTDGSVVIRIGYAAPDGQGPDLYSPALRVWASFMDPFERIVINPDHSFHQRIATAHADAGDDDPDKANLATASSYAGIGGRPPAPLFTSAEQSAGQPANCATAIGQMRSGMGFGGSGPQSEAAYRFGRIMRHASGRKSARRALRGGVLRAGTACGAAADKYVAYADMVDTGYFPVNIPASRPVTTLQPTGLVLSKPHGQPPSAATWQVTDHATAQAEFDALPPPSANPPWAPTGAALGDSRRFGNIFADFWHWLKQEFDELAVEITDIAITIADEVMVGIRMLVNGIEQVFKAVVREIDDIAGAIGSFFKMLIKAIEDVIAALSVLFHFGEIIWTQNWLVEQVTTHVDQIKLALTTQIKPAIDGFFESGEDAIKAQIDKLRAQITGDATGNTASAVQIGHLPGMGSTPHSVFSVGPRGGTASSHATQCSYGLQRLKSGIPLASTITAMGTPAATAGDPLTDFFSGFLARLESDGDLGQVTSQFKADFNRLMHVNAGDFFSTLLLVLLDIIEVLMIGALAVANAFIDGFLAVIDDAIATIMGVLTYNIEIPFLSWLYKTLFHQDLTILNLLMLVAAIPLTILVRVVEGQWPRQVLPRAEVAPGTVRTAQAPAIVREILGVLTGLMAACAGMLNGSIDALPEVATEVESKASVGLGLLMEAFSFPLIYNASTDVSTMDWVVYGVGVYGAMLGLLTVVFPGEPEVPAMMTSMMGLTSIACAVTAFVEDGKTDAASNVGFAANVANALPPMVNAAKLTNEVVAVVVGLVDIACGWTDCALDITEVFLPQAERYPA